MIGTEPDRPAGDFAVRLEPLGDRSMVAELGMAGPDDVFRPAPLDSVTSRAVHALVARLDAAAADRLIDIVPAYRSVVVIYDPDRFSLEGVRTIIGDRIAPVADDAASRLVTIPVRYGGDDGPDLDDVAAHTGLSPDEVVALHTGGSYTVSFVGFAPGFGYLSGLPEPLRLPRLTTPRPRVPVGSVAIGGAQTAVYPSATPGGWRLIGRTPVPMFDAARGEPALLRPGDRVRFRAVTQNEADALANAVVRGGYRPEIEGEPAPAAPGLRRRGTLRSTQSVPGFDVLAGGPQTTAQDRGRPGYGRQGIAPNGALDRAAAAWSNRIVGNDPDAAVLEMVLAGPTLRARRRLTVCLAGAGLAATVNGRSVPTYEAIGLRAGDVLTCGPLRGGIRGYLAVAGGVATPIVLGSRSTDLAGRFGGMDGRPVRVRDVLPVGVARRPPPSITVGPAIAPLPTRGVVVVRVVAGPHLDLLDATARRRLFDAPFVVSPQSDRMGLRLRGEPIAVAGAGDLVSEGVTTGVVQVPGDGQPIILLAGRQSVGGYPKPACVIDADLDLLGRLEPGTAVRLHLVSLAEAAHLGRAHRQRLSLLSLEMFGTLPQTSDGHDSTSPTAASVESAPSQVHSPAVGRFRLAAGVAISELSGVVLPTAGRLLRLLVADGTGVECGQPLAVWLPQTLPTDDT